MVLADTHATESWTYPKRSAATRAPGPAPVIHDQAVLSDVTLGPWTEVGSRTNLNEVVMGAYSYIERDCLANYATIGRFCSIAEGVNLNPGNHPMERAALNHFTYRAAWYGLGEDDAAFFQRRRDKPVTLGNDVWIGYGAAILAGVTIGTGAVVGAGAVVTHDVEPFQVVVGVPAQPLRHRFSANVQQKLLQLAWWSWPHEQLQAAMHDFRELSAEAFADKYLSLRGPALGAGTA